MERPSSSSSRRAEVEEGGLHCMGRAPERSEVGQRFGLVFSGAASRRTASLAAAVCTCCCVPYHAIAIAPVSSCPPTHAVAVSGPAYE